MRAKQYTTVSEGRRISEHGIAGAQHRIVLLAQFWTWRLVKGQSLCSTLVLFMLSHHQRMRPASAPRLWPHCEYIKRSNGSDDSLEVVVNKFCVNSLGVSNASRCRSRANRSRAYASLPPLSHRNYYLLRLVVLIEPGKGVAARVIRQERVQLMIVWYGDASGRTDSPASCAQTNASLQIDADPVPPLLWLDSGNGHLGAGFVYLPWWACS